MKGGNGASETSEITQFAGTANQTPRIVHTNPTKPITSPGCSPSSGYNLTAPPSRNSGSLQESPEREHPLRPAGSRLSQPPLIFNHKEHKEHKEMGDDTRSCLSLAAEASKNLQNAASPSACWFADVSSAGGEAPLPVRAPARNVL